MNEDFSQIEIRNSKLSLLKKMELDKLKITDIRHIFSFKHKGLILFKKDDVYDGYWQETRYIETGEEGVAIVFNEYCKHRITTKSFFLAKKYANISIYKITESNVTRDLYTEKRFYSLQSGLKVGRLTYLYGAGPKLILTQKSKFWIDGEMMENPSDNASLDLYNFGTGKHIIRFPNFKKIEFEIVLPKVGSQKWLEQYNKWKIVKEDNLWNSERQSEGIIGLDFTSIPQFNEKIKGSVFERWSKMHIFGSKQINDSNIAIKVLSNIKKSYV